MQVERRLRLYSKIMDPPGEARPDFWIAAQIARRMGFEGFDWANSNEVFEEAAEPFRGSVHDYAALVELAHDQGKRGLKSSIVGPANRPIRSVLMLQYWLGIDLKLHPL